MSKRKIQSLLMRYLQKFGSIELLLPDNVVLEIGVTQEDKEGQLVVKDNYCWVMASRENRTACLDAFNLGLRCPDADDILVFEDKFVRDDGETIRRLDIC